MKVLAWVAAACVAAAVKGQDGSFQLNSRGGVEVIQGLQPPHRLLHHHRALSADSRQPTPYAATRDQYNQPTKYAWSYAVDASSTGDRKFAREQREGNLVLGQYSLVDPDGSLRVVDYSVTPQTGFQATVNKEQKVASPLDKIQYQGQQNTQLYQNQNFNVDQYQLSNQFQEQNQWQDNVQQSPVAPQSSIIPSSGVIVKSSFSNYVNPQQQHFNPNLRQVQQTRSYFNRFSPKMKTHYSRDYFGGSNFQNSRSYFTTNNARSFGQSKMGLHKNYSPISVVLAN